jgi:ribulose-5-phosphate 4-epimerase/fuculose-1-phosphate aldolase
MGTAETHLLGKPAHVSDAEWRLRIQLAACYRVLDWLGWTENIFNHITVRVPGPERHFLINPFGLWYDEVTASNLVKIDLDGHPVAPTEHAVNRAGFIIHSALHAAREDAHCIIHTHTTAGMAIACRRAGLAHDDFYGAMLIGRVAYHDFEGITVRPEEQPRLVASLGAKHVLILRNHGLLVAERNVPHAFSLMWTLQRACEVQCQAAAIGGYDLPLTDAVREQCREVAFRYEADGDTCERVFDATVRKMERAKRSAPGWIDYRT